MDRAGSALELLSGQGERGAIDALGEVEAAVLRSRSRWGLTWATRPRDLAARSAHDAHDPKPERARRVTTLSFVEEDQVSAELDCQGDRLGLARAEIRLQRRDQSLVPHLVAPDPRRRSDLIGSGPPLHTDVELLPDRFRNVDLAVDPVEQVELSDRGQTGDRRGVTDDDQGTDRSPTAAASS
jgi:hypothetical protein